MARLRNRRVKRATAHDNGQAVALAPSPRRLDRGAAPAALHQADEFRERIRSEREQSVRDGRIISLLMFSFDSVAAKEDQSLVAAALSWHLGPEDAIGEWSPSEIGALLPGTSLESALSAARNICGQFTAERSRDCRCTAYVYPADHHGREPSRAGDIGPIATRPMEALFAIPLPTWKRAMDLVGASIGLTILSPLLLLVALLIKLTSRGPILFSQEREGLGGRRFTMFKFRSMIQDAESQRDELHALNERDGPAFKIKNDPRTTRLGRLLRRTGIDEMPQFWNVLKGDMSLVGPRPLPIAESQACLPWQRRRLDVTPGLTCLWQARGGLHVSFDDWMRMDLEYVENHGFWVDVVLLLQTAWRALLMRASH